jgi:hypothetical protein
MRCAANIRPGPGRVGDSPGPSESELVGAGPFLCHLNRTGPGCRRRNIFSMFSEGLNMEGDCLPDVRRCFLDGRTSRNASGQIRDVRRKIRSSVFDHNGILGHRCLRANPACLTMVPTVPLANSSPSRPGTVTVPGFDGCRNCRWLPTWRTCIHPSSRSSRTISLTFTWPSC